jgi:hypothetical protein
MTTTIPRAGFFELVSSPRPETVRKTGVREPTKHKIPADASMPPPEVKGRRSRNEGPPLPICERLCAL